MREALTQDHLPYIGKLNPGCSSRSATQDASVWLQLLASPLTKWGSSCSMQTRSGNPVRTPKSERLPTSELSFTRGFMNELMTDWIDNNNCAPSFLRSLCEIGGDCFGPRYFSEGAQLPKKHTEVQNNHRRIHTMTKTKMVQSYYCH